ncbi:unnamed protein product [Eruca vesicaria subsp. sativa]|uniref:WRKY domain-containing protein n=1 Tax=Eruca vesicaria subsp. sativa TaxID=29727 RepID=A0ABC8K751_ERUVS|nr:unnamed protein product [Eruca vesicaria subsp. sativa]
MSYWDDNSMEMISSWNSPEMSDCDETSLQDSAHRHCCSLQIRSLTLFHRKYEVSNMFGAKRTRKDERVILRMECEEDNPDDGFQWRKYGRKTVSGNSNPRSYYKCTFAGCKVKKHVERGADDVNLLVTTYDGKHNHPTPTGRSSTRSGPRNRSGFSVSQRFRGLPSSSPACQYCTSSLKPQLYMTGHSKLPSFPVYHNHARLYRGVQWDQ